MTVEDVQAHLHISRSTVFRLLRTNRLTGVMLGRRRMIHQESVARMIAAPVSA